MAIESLQRNPEARHSDLLVFSDAARRDEDRGKVDAVRAYIATISGFKSVGVIAREHNLGLAKSITGGVTQVCATHGRVIVLEDDLLLSPHFLRYMNDGLERYARAPQVASIHGYNYPLDVQLPETFFMRGADCWGWATWSRAWQVFEPDAAKLLGWLNQRGLAREFDLDGAGPYIRMLEDFIAGKNDSWAVRWHASTFLQGMFTLYPGRSLLRNMGTDGSGTHAGAVDIFDGGLTERPVAVDAIEIAESGVAREAFKRYFRSARPSVIARIMRRVRRRLWSIPAQRMRR
jgi:hypothetical protein